MNEKKEYMIDVLIIRVPLCSHLIVFLEEDCKKKISISHLLEGNWNSRILVV